MGLVGWILEILFSIHNPVLVAIVVLIISHHVLKNTAFGRHTCCWWRESANLMGLPVKKTILSVYIISGSLSGLAGVILASQFGAGQPTEGLGWELFAITQLL